MSSLVRLTTLALLAFVGVVLEGACTDPVRDAEIAALGGEDPNVPPGENHRPGQPCLHCHSKGGPAADHSFAVGGTIFETDAFDSKPASNVTVQFVDARGGAPRIVPVTNDVGNFWVPLEDWPDMAFPVRVGIYDDATRPPVQTMKSLINREGSCNFCHRPNLKPDQLTKDDIEDNKRSTGQIYVKSGGG
jgi:hypothetical protein